MALSRYAPYVVSDNAMMVEGRVMAITRAQAEASNLIEEFLDCMVHPLEEKLCELVVEVPSGEFMLTSCYMIV
ncbi:hypothetical protein Taro_016465 [Colocasia esculenta]|uniref:Uncharacterized protein n=1 Tax=Colocasia esculenta TaxID=4460 RepID=A0A843UT15_COLES|nr:hypothetical protein [Colocasia esculenta]